MGKRREEGELKKSCRLTHCEIGEGCACVFVGMCDECVCVCICVLCVCVCVFLRVCE
jgi:hypothetical protein